MERAPPAADVCLGDGAQLAAAEGGQQVARDDARIAACRRGLPVAHRAPVREPVGGELVEGHNLARIGRRLGRSQLGLVLVDELAHARDGLVGDQVAGRTGSAALAPSAPARLDPRRADQPLDLAALRVAPLGVVDQAARPGLPGGSDEEPGVESHNRLHGLNSTDRVPNLVPTPPDRTGPGAALLSQLFAI